jgi:hydrogenase maturation factor HypF (carbamoyltransferase family)
MSELTYCEKCLRNLTDEQFDYRFDYPVCSKCVDELKLIPDTTEGGN